MSSLQMILSFGDKDTEQLFLTEKNRRFAPIVRIALRKLIQLNRAVVLKDLAIPPGNHLELLKGKSHGWYSIRVNTQWRIIFQWTNDGKINVSIVDYH